MEIRPAKDYKKPLYAIGLVTAIMSVPLTGFVEVVSEELQKGGKVQLIGFGSFETVKKAARTGRNPQTGAETKIPACTAPKFKAGQALKDQVNSKKSKK